MCRKNKMTWRESRGGQGWSLYPEELLLLLELEKLLEHQMLCRKLTE